MEKGDGSACNRLCAESGRWWRDSLTQGLRAQLENVLMAIVRVGGVGIFVVTAFPGYGDIAALHWRVATRAATVGS